MKKKGIFLALALIAALTFSGGSFAYARTQTSNAMSVNISSAAGVGGNVANVAIANTSLHSSFADITTAAASFSKNSSGTIVSNTPGTSGVAPKWTPTVNTAGRVISGDLYYIDIGSYTGDIMVTIYLNNPSALSHDYSYLNLPINVYGGTYTGSSGSYVWTWNTSSVSGFQDASGNYTTYLNMTGGYASFILQSSETTAGNKTSGPTTGGTVHTFFAITIGSGNATSGSASVGSYYCIGTTDGDLAPQFYITTLPIR